MSNKYILSKKNISLVLTVGLLIGIIVVANQMAKGSQKLEIQSKQNHDLSHFNKISTFSNITTPVLAANNATSANITTPVLAANNATSANITTPVLAANNATSANITTPVLAANNATSANITTPVLAANNATSANITTPVLAANNATSANITTPVLADNYSINKTSFTSQKPGKEIVNLQQVTTPKADQVPNKQISKKSHSNTNINTPNNLDDNTQTKSVHKIKSNHKSTDQLNTNSISHSKTTSKKKTNTFSDPSTPSESFDLPFAAIVPDNLF